MGKALERAFGGRLNRLSESAHAAVVVAAAAGNRDDVPTLEQAWSRLGARRDELADAERSGIISIEDGRLRFRHPLVRAVAYGTASGRIVERRTPRSQPRSTMTPSPTNVRGTSLSRRRARTRSGGQIEGGRPPSPGTQPARRASGARPRRGAHA